MKWLGMAAIVLLLVGGAMIVVRGLDSDRGALPYLVAGSVLFVLGLIAFGVHAFKSGERRH